MTPPIKTLALYTALLTGSSLAETLAFSKPSSGSYPCFVSQKNYFDMNATRGFTLELKSGGEYQLQRSGGSISGRYLSQKITADSTQFAKIFETGGNVVLMEADGKTPALLGLYLAHSSGQGYLMLQDPEQKGSFVRCGQGDPLKAARAAQNTPSIGQGGKPPKTQTSQKPLKPAAKPRFQTAPGKGLGVGAVLGLGQTIEYQGMKYNVMSGTYSGEHDVSDYLILKDGSIYEGWPEVPLEDFDSAASKKAEPKLWGRWTRGAKSEGFAVTWPSGQKETLEISFVQPAASGEKLSGNFYKVGTGSAGVEGSSTFAFGWRDITFYPDGRFDTSKGGATDSNQSGTDITTGNSSKTSGRYQVSGTLLELTYADGSKERKQFFYSSAKKDWIYMDGVRMLKSK